MTNNVNKDIAKGALWMLALRFSVKGIGIISTIILARLLMPEDFGLMALASSIYAFVELIRAFGFDTVLIQNQKASKSHYDTAWTLQVIFACISALLIVIISYPVSDYYEDQRLTSILQIMSLIIFIGGFNNIGVVEFRKKMTFNKEFKYQIFIKLSAFLVTIPVAFYLQSYWALLFGMLSGSIASLIFSYTLQNYRPSINLKEWREIFRFSSWLMFNNVLFFINNHSQNFLLGKLTTPASLGTFSIANEIATITTTEIIAPINRAAFPGYSKLSHDINQLKQSYLNVLSGIVLIAVPSAIGIAVIAPVLIPILLGEKWLDAIPIIQIIAISSIMTSLNTNSGYIYLALSKQKITTALMCVQLVTFLPLLYYFTSKSGIEGAAFAILLTSILLFPLSIIIVKKQIELRWLELYSIVYRPLISALAMGLVVRYFIGILSGHISELLVLIVLIFLGVTTFCITLYITWNITGKKTGIETRLVTIIAKKIRSKKININ